MGADGSTDGYSASTFGGGNNKDDSAATPELPDDYYPYRRGLKADERGGGA